MQLKEVSHIRTGSNHFPDLQTFFAFRDNLREITGITSRPVRRETLMRDGIILSEDIVLDADGYGYTKTRIWRSREDYLGDTFTGQGEPPGWYVVSITTSVVEY